MYINVSLLLGQQRATRSTDFRKMITDGTISAAATAFVVSQTERTFCMLDVNNVNNSIALFQ